MENFIFSINTALPIMFAMLLGVGAKKIGVLKDEMLPVLDKFALYIGMPLLMFTNVSKMDLYTEFSLSFALFCILTSLASFLIIWFVALRVFPEKSVVGAFTQASARGSISLLAVAIVTNIYGSAGIAALMNACVVPVYNIMSVLILTLCGSEDQLDFKQQMKKAFWGIAKNPLILGILAGLPFAIFRIELPLFLSKPISNLANCATPVGLMSMGAAFHLKDATARLKPALAASAIKLIILPAVGLPIAMALGFRDAAMCSAMLMLGSATTPSCYIMATQMGCDGPLSSNIVVFTQLCFCITLTFWLFLLKTLALI